MNPHSKMHTALCLHFVLCPWWCASTPHAQTAAAHFPWIPLRCELVPDVITSAELVWYLVACAMWTLDAGNLHASVSYCKFAFQHSFNCRWQWTMHSGIISTVVNSRGHCEEFHCCTLLDIQEGDPGPVLLQWTFKFNVENTNCVASD